MLSDPQIPSMLALSVARDRSVFGFPTRLMPFLTILILRQALFSRSIERGRGISLTWIFVFSRFKDQIERIRIPNVMNTTPYQSVVPRLNCWHNAMKAIDEVFQILD